MKSATEFWSNPSELERLEETVLERQDKLLFPEVQKNPRPDKRRAIGLQRSWYRRKHSDSAV